MARNRRTSIEGNSYREKTFNECPIGNPKGGDCTSYVHCPMEGYNSCLTYLKSEIENIKNDTLLQGDINSDRTKFIRKSMIEIIKKCDRPIFRSDLLKFAAKSLGEITRKEYESWKNNGGLK